MSRAACIMAILHLHLSRIAEFDAMVGAYMQAIEDAGLTDSTYWVITADHGDMQMEHQQFYKMVPYDASASVGGTSTLLYHGTELMWSAGAIGDIRSWHRAWKCDCTYRAC
eukprot:TRINITY_DN11771_c0_g1_i7.p3 TRINITY_DN11771_c0_g1~~TRINITY_DN11771_c0_g1_i7.p3  ORF type:complete len:111 (+),score=13.94 TRINITY_DN11771_c0_g1_i7:862-1194(+)